MTTIGGDNRMKDMKEKKKMPTKEKRIAVNLEFLADEIGRIQAEIENVIIPAAEEAVKKAGRIPYTLSIDGFHNSELSSVIDSSLLLLQQDMKSISTKTWQQYKERYLSSPKEEGEGGKETRYEKGFKHVIFYPQMIETADTIGNYIATYADVTIPYLIMGGKVSHKIIASIAIIHAAEVLRVKDEQSG